MADEPGDAEDPFVELFHELRTSHSDGQRAPAARGVFGVTVGLVIGFALIIAAVVALGKWNGNDGAAGAGVYVCGGEDATITGTDGDDVITGTPGRDVIHARKGNDIVKPSAGADLICGGMGADELNGGRGKDTLIGGDGVDVCVGGQAEDTFKGCETEEQ